MGNRAYTEEEIILFVNKAAEVGIDNAIKELSYPARNTAVKWCANRAVTPPARSVLAISGVTRDATRIDRSMKEILLNLKEHYDVQVQQAVLDNDSITLKRLTEGMKILNETLKSVYGEASAAVDKAESIDSSFIQLVKEMNAKSPIEEDKL